MSSVSFRHSTFQSTRKPGTSFRDSPPGHIYQTYEVKLDLPDTQPETVAATLKLVEQQVKKAAGIGPSPVEIERATKLLRDSVTFGENTMDPNVLVAARNTLKEADVSIF